MHRIEINVITGEKKFIDLTPEEITEAQLKRAEIDAQPKLPSLEDRLAELEALVKGKE